jgi:tetratricopeptide (TPR) repeat protein
MLVIVAFAALAGRQVRYWQDSVTLFRHAIDVTGSNWLAHWGLGDLARDRGDVATAIDEYHRSIADREINFHAYAALGNIWRSNPAVAVKYYRKAVEYAPHPAPQRVALARMLMESGQLNEAETQLRTALAEEPDNADALIGLKDVTTRLRAAGGQVR